jgi:hypothetical protein
VSTRRPVRVRKIGPAARPVMASRTARSTGMGRRDVGGLGAGA